jgi:putative lipoprotein
MKYYLLPLLLLPFLALAEDEKIAYACDDGSQFDISFLADISGRPQAVLHLTEGAIVLPMVPSGSGALYRDGDIRLHTKGNDALLEDGKSPMRRCTRGTVPPVVTQAAPTAPQAGAVSSFMEVTGTVRPPNRTALPPGAIMTIRIQASGRTLVEQRYELVGMPEHIPFSATVDRDLVGKKARLSITARVTVGNKTRFFSAAVHPVMSAKQPQAVNIVLKPAAHAQIR